METQTATGKRIVTFLTLTFALSSIFYLLKIYLGSYVLYITGLMWCPGIAALLTQYVYRRSVSEFGWGWGKTEYQLLSYAVPLIYILVAYVILWASGLGGFYDEKFVANVGKKLGLVAWRPGFVIVFFVLLQCVFGVTQTFASALGEEIGWRGFLVPQLARITTFTKTALLSGLIWAVWHYPIFLFPGFTNTFATWYGLACFTVMVIGIGFIFAWFRLKTGSLWTGVFLHASHNLFVQWVFTPLTRDTGKTVYFVDETGAFLAVAAVLAGFIFWRMGSRLPRMV